MSRLSKQQVERITRMEGVVGTDLTAAVNGLDPEKRKETTDTAAKIVFEALEFYGRLPKRKQKKIKSPEEVFKFLFEASKQTHTGKIVSARVDAVTAIGGKEKFELMRKIHVERLTPYAIYENHPIDGLRKKSAFNTAVDELKRDGWIYKAKPDAKRSEYLLDQTKIEKAFGIRCDDLFKLPDKQTP